MGHFPNLGKNKFSPKKELCQFWNILIIYHHAKKLEQTNGPFLRKMLNWKIERHTGNDFTGPYSHYKEKVITDATKYTSCKNRPFRNYSKEWPWNPNKGKRQYITGRAICFDYSKVSNHGSCETARTWQSFDNQETQKMPLLSDELWLICNFKNFASKSKMKNENIKLEYVK